MTNDASKVSESHESWLRQVAEALYAQQRDYSIANTCEEAADAMAALRASHERLERDAARYRWLREFRSPVTFEPFIAVHGAGGFSQWVGEGADAAVDAAIDAARSAP